MMTELAATENIDEPEAARGAEDQQLRITMRYSA